MHPSLAYTDHRPYPLNSRPWLMQQDWYDLAFIHWPVDPELLLLHVPKSFQLELFDGAAWIGVVPFEMTAAPHGSPIPCSLFPELNVRTYVRCGDKSGVYFFSLDAASTLAVFGARTAFHLPYFHARMRVQRANDWILYDSKRIDSRGHDAVFRGDYRPVGEIFAAARDTLEHFLTERYCLFLEHNRKPYCVDIHHRQWQLQQAEIHISSNTMLNDLDLKVAAERPHVLFAKHTSVINWGLEPAD
jgi:uncharacterized protein YqjF (DUF2071 family)